jgi:hypothetical protein
MGHWVSHQIGIRVHGSLDHSSVWQTIDWNRMKGSLKSEEAQHEFAAKALTDAVEKCENNGVSPEVTMQTLLSVGATFLLSCCEADDAANMLEGMAATIRSGKITRDDA